MVRDAQQNDDEHCCLSSSSSWPAFFFINFALDISLVCVSGFSSLFPDAWTNAWMGGCVLLCAMRKMASAHLVALVFVVFCSFSAALILFLFYF